MALLGWPKTLRWSDFGKAVSAVPMAYTGSHTDCHTEVSIDGNWHGTARVKPGGDYQLREVKVVVSILANDTWVLDGVAKAKNQAQVLKHEQGHFNIAGITARDLERALKALRNSDSDALEADASSTMSTILTAGQTEEETYDDDPANGGTDHGNDVTQQSAWNSKIAAAKSLDDLP